ncbi:hypothetical protein DFJ74DRAFT_688450 [Hyaloraphidium curvatum]|nr:hypothetical protein DFJ74DRAFT_688450 [Hyaloraphidium curvatum]
MLGATMGLAIFAAYGASLSVAPDYSTHAAAGLVRWVQMTKGRMPTDHGFIDLPLSPLLEHQDGDPHCPCSKQSCAGGIPVRAGWLLGFEIGFKLCYTLANVLLISWTPLAYPNIARSLRPYASSGFPTTWPCSASRNALSPMP